MAAEFWMDHVAGVLKRPTEELRELNMFREGEETHFTQILDKCQVCTCVLLLAMWSCCKFLLPQAAVFQHDLL